MIKLFVIAIKLTAILLCLLIVGCDECPRDKVCMDKPQAVVDPNNSLDATYQGTIDGCDHF
jgi:hypothetical protein